MYADESGYPNPVVLFVGRALKFCVIKPNFTFHTFYAVWLLFELDFTSLGGQLYDKKSGQLLLETWEKMSKSKHNGVDPQVCAEVVSMYFPFFTCLKDLFIKYGCDVTRLLVTANASPQSHRCWNLDGFFYLIRISKAGLRGIQNWINRVYWIVATIVEQRLSVGSCEGKTTDATTEDSLKEARNYFVRQKCTLKTVAESPEFERSLRCLLIMMQPFVPHHLPVWEQKWPAADKSADMVLIVQMNGKRVERIRISSETFNSLDEEIALGLAMKYSSVKEQLSQKYLRSYRLELSPALGGRLLLQVV
ncbi:Probable leucyl-tRNA synthetase, mitochondrial [Trichuris trichiura]|uniref:leucine--tRNA ligase n=1 Tax=Trichuris trichiura TaxID=36087 RepID=A0A077Z1D8_TRITR|nr:Probable leucyl-tRNA synthetase, mitochondrial [Trichuris trichiura]